LTVLTQQQHETSLGSQPVPDQLRLALLPPDPRTWPPLTFRKFDGYALFGG
jgi:hypothetical protein